MNLQENQGVLESDRMGIGEIHSVIGNFHTYVKNVRMYIYLHSSFILFDTA